MKKMIYSLLICTLLVTISQPAHAQQDDTATCDTFVAEALNATDVACTGLERNQFCYGNLQITSMLASDDVTFSEQGDIVGVADIQQLELAPYTPEDNIWGVAIAQVQANIPGTLPGQGVSMVLFGGGQLEPADENMSAFTFRGGVGSPTCTGAPNGLLIQTPEGVAEVALTINGVDVMLGSTAFITAEPEADLLLALLEGNASVSAAGQTQALTEGELLTVPLDENLTPTGEPTEPEAIVYGDDGIVLPAVFSVANSLLPEAIPTPENVTAAAPTSGGAASGAIQPLDGVWTATIGNVQTSGCPAGMANMMSGNIQAFGGGTSNAITFPEPFDLGQVFMENAGNVQGAAMSFDNPAPNEWIITITVDGGVITYDYTIVSESQMDVLVTMDLGSIGCTITVPMTVTHGG